MSFMSKRFVLAGSFVLLACLTLMLLAPWPSHGALDDPDMIVVAILGKTVSDEDIIAAIKRLKDVNGYSASADQSFLAAASRFSDRRDLVKWLLRSGADANPTGLSPLYAACMSDDVDTVVTLLRAGARWDRALPEGDTVLRRVMTEHKAILVRLREIEPNLVPIEGSTSTEN